MGLNNEKEALWSETIGAVSDVVARRPDWMERPSELFEAFDTIDLNQMREQARELRPRPIRHRMRAFLLARLRPLMKATTGAMMAEAA